MKISTIFFELSSLLLPQKEKNGDGIYEYSKNIDWQKTAMNMFFIIFGMMINKPQELTPEKLKTMMEEVQKG